MRQAALKQQETEPVELGEITSSIGFLLRMAQLKTFDAFYENLSTHGLKPGEFTVLWVIGKNPGLRQGTIAGTLDIKAAHMTKLIQRLVLKGLVERNIPDSDRRSVRLALTATGRQFVKKHRQAFLEFHQLERSALTDKEYRQLLKLLQKFTGLEEK